MKWMKWSSFEKSSKRKLICVLYLFFDTPLRKEKKVHNIRVIPTGPWIIFDTCSAREPIAFLSVSSCVEMFCEWPSFERQLMDGQVAHREPNEQIN